MNILNLYTLYIFFFLYIMLDILKTIYKIFLAIGKEKQILSASVVHTSCLQELASCIAWQKGTSWISAFRKYVVKVIYVWMKM